jgi:hypothetical protein
MAKDLFGVISEVADSVANGKTNREELEKALEELSAFIAEQKANAASSAPDREDFTPPTYERMDYKEMSVEEMKAAAEAMLGDLKLSSERAIEQEIESLGEGYEKARKSAESAAGEKTEAVEDAYRTAEKIASDDALKRGLARSSIAVNRQSELAAESARQKTAIASKFTDEIADLEQKIAGLGQKRAQALADFNIAYAAKVTAQMQDLQAEQEKKKAEALKYNNSLTEKEYEAGVTAKEKEAELYAKELQNREKNQGAADDGSEAVYQKMCELLDGLNGADARAAVMENAIFRDSLNDYYYYKLYDRYTR